MQIYSATASRRLRQIIADVAGVLAVALSIGAGLAVAGTIQAASSLGEAVEGAGDRFDGTMSSAAETLGSVPLLGSGIGAPFVAASDAGAELSAVGRQLQSLVQTAAVTAGLVVALVLLAIVGFAWLRPRLRFVRSARETRALLALPGGQQILAVRALARRPASALLREGEGFALDGLIADPVALGRLVELELAATR